MTPVQFRCDGCGRDVPFMDSGLLRYEHRNHCPWCLCSKHIMFGCENLPPCDGLMRPIGRIGTACPQLIVTECEGCGFRGVSYDEDWWALLSPQDQVLMIGTAVAEMKRQNPDPVGFFMVKPEYRTPAPVIPARLRGTRMRVARRPWTTAASPTAART